jgi:hypothetical protein
MTAAITLLCALKRRAAPLAAWLAGLPAAFGLAVLRAVYVPSGAECTLRLFAAPG